MLDFLRAEPAVASQIRFVVDAWRDEGRQWNLIPLPAGIRLALGSAGRRFPAAATRRPPPRAGRGQVPEPVVVMFSVGWSGAEEIPDSLELTALARWLAEEGAGYDASGTAPGGELPQVQITGFGNGPGIDRSDESARRTGQRRADVLRARLLAGVGDYLRQLGADPGIAGRLLQAGQGPARRLPAELRGSGHRGGPAADPGE